MLNIRDLRIDPASLGTKKLLVDVAPAYEYKDGKRTDTVTGYRYIVALPAHSLEKIGVRIDGKQLMEKPEGFIEVEFADLEVTAYESQGHVQLTAKATGISTVRKIDGRNRAAKAQQTGNRYFSSRKISPGGSASAAPLPHGKYYRGAAR